MKKILFSIVCLCLFCFPLALRAAPTLMEAVSGSGDAFHDPFEKAEKTGQTVSKPKMKISDPIEPVNRAFFTVNDRLYFWLLKPVETGYKTVLPKPARICANRVFLNARFPIRLVNNVLQGKFKSAGIETTRFVLNTTFGIGGLFDPAGRRHLTEQKADLDQTLAKYRVPTGIYLCWPVLGPSSVRGTVGMAGDSMLTPWGYCNLLSVSLGVPAFEMINAGSLHLGEYEEFKNSTLDPYVAMRSAYFENRSSSGQPDEMH